MKLIIAGSRTLELDGGALSMALGLAQTVTGKMATHVFTGDASGVDAAARKAFKTSRPTVVDGHQRTRVLRVFKADWETHGKAAGPIRNAEMAEAGDALLLIWDGKSRGSASMKREAEKRGLPIVEVVLHPGVKP